MSCNVTTAHSHPCAYAGTPLRAAATPKRGVSKPSSHARQKTHTQAMVSELIIASQSSDIHKHEDVVLHVTICDGPSSSVSCVVHFAECHLQQ